MEIRTEDYEQLGKFYLGRAYDLGDKKLEDDLVLYDSKDLVTHGVVLNPLFPASGLAIGSLNGLNPKSKFLAFIKSKFLAFLSQDHDS
jgi:hypothetical protein